MLVLCASSEVNNQRVERGVAVWPPTTVQLLEFYMTHFDLILYTVDAFNSVQYC